MHHSPCTQERQQHVARVTQLLFTTNGSRLLSCGADGRVVVYAARHGLLPVNTLVTPAPAAAGTKAGSSSAVCAAVSGNGQHIAVGQPSAGAEEARVVLFAAGSMEAVLEVVVPVTGFSRCARARRCGDAPQADGTLACCGCG